MSNGSALNLLRRQTGSRSMRGGRPALLLLPALVFVLLAATGGTVRAQSGYRIEPPKKEYHLGDENKLEINVNVWGEVRNPGSYRVSDDVNLTELISLAGGPTDFADLGSIKISRSVAGDMSLMKVDLKKILDADSPDPDFSLYPGDTVRVPRNAKHTWRSVIQTMSDVAVVATLYVLLRDRGFYQ